jgi:hypothetical protein
MPLGNFGDPLKLAFHNLIKGAFVGLQTKSMGETLYYIISQTNESIKNLKRCIYRYALPKSQNHPSNNLLPTTYNLKSPKFY